VTPVNALHRKLLRDLGRMRGQALAIGAVIACGVATFVMSLCVLATLTESRDRFYEEYHFAEVFARVSRAPDSTAQRLREIPGVARAQTRIVKDVTLEVEGLSEPAIGRLISLPQKLDGGAAATAALNGVSLRRGRLPDGSRKREVAVGEAFAEAHDLGPGDKVHAILNGARTELEIVRGTTSPCRSPPAARSGK
jgi:putative ABC transport system permease protein